MSFLNTIRGFGRNSKKNRKDEPSAISYQNTSNTVSQNGNAMYNGGGSPLKRTQSPTKSSPTKQQQQQQQQQQRIQFSSNSPTKPRQYRVSHHQSQNQLNNNSNTSLGRNSQKESLSSDKPLFLCEPFVKTALVKGSFKTIVTIPKYVDYGEWLALNVFESYTHLNQFYGVISEYVTPEAYPTMNAGPGTDYLWMDSNNNTVVLPAGQYIEYVLTWISNKLNDQSLFPTKNGGSFPPNFLKDCKNITRQMFRIFAHIYHNHFDKIVHLSLEAHWNSFFAHFVSFVKEFNLLERKEMEPLLPLIENLESQGKII